MALADDKERRGFVAWVDGLFDRLISSWNPYHPTRLPDLGLTPVEIEESRVRKNGTRVLLVAFAAFFVWAVTAPLDAGASLPGTVTVAGYRKAVQHPTGGVVSRVLVSEGDEVKQGQVLVRINPLDTEATVANLEQEYITLLVSESRAKAQLLGRPIVWDPELTKLDPAQVADAKAIQVKLFQSRQAQMNEQMRGLNAQLAGLAGSISSHQVQLGTLDQELKSVQDLASQGFVPKAQVNQTLRSKVDQQAALEGNRSDMGKIRASMAEARSQMQNDVAKELADLEKNRESVSTKLDAARFSQSLSEIRAPIAGTIVNLKVFTEGGVIRGGDVLMEIVPKNGSLIIEAKVPPTAIDKIHVGQTADVRFTTFNAATTPIVQGIVKSVGVDKQKAQPGEDLRQDEDYYLAQVETPPAALRVLGTRQLRPGMPAEVVVKTGERTFMSYLLKPLSDKFARAFKE